MTYTIQKATDVLRRTPPLLETLLNGLDPEWIHANEGSGTWSPFQVVGHLIVNEETNFLFRAQLILAENNPVLAPINMTEHLERFTGTSIDSILKMFADLRRRNLDALQSLNISDTDLSRTARHPKVGTVRLSNILSTWVAHDLIHIGQITRVIAKQYRSDVGPFIEFLPRLQ